MPQALVCKTPGHAAHAVPIMFGHAGLRLFTPATTATVRMLPHPVATGRQGTLPRGAQVFVTPYTIHHSTRVRSARSRLLPD